MKGGLSKEVVSDEGGVGMGHTTFMTSKVSLTKEVFIQEGGLSKEVLLYCMTQETVSIIQKFNNNICITLHKNLCPEHLHCH